jgi:hypothetical protein
MSRRLRARESDELKRRRAILPTAPLGGKTWGKMNGDNLTKTRTPIEGERKFRHGALSPGGAGQSNSNGAALSSMSVVLIWCERARNSALADGNTS